MTLQRRAVLEVEELHRFFSVWFAGTVAKTEPVFARLDLVLAPSFQMVSVQGRRRGREQVVEEIRKAHGVGATAVWVESAEATQLGEGLVVVVYEEWQDRGEGAAGRLSTAVMRHMPALPNEVQWLHLHETPLV